MSEQPLGQIPLVDPGNGLLEHVPSRMDTGTVELPGQGTLGVLTIRTQSTTLTVMLGADDLRQWGGILTGLADQLGGGLVKASLMDVAAMEVDPGMNLGLPSRRTRRGGLRPSTSFRVV